MYINLLGTRQTFIQILLLWTQHNNLDHEATYTKSLVQVTNPPLEVDLRHGASNKPYFTLKIDKLLYYH